MKKIIIFTLTALLTITPSLASASAMRIPDADSPEAKRFAERCGACHSLPHPKRLDWRHWRSMLHIMKRRMEERGMRMTAEEWRQIAAYLKAHAR